MFETLFVIVQMKLGRYPPGSRRDFLIKKCTMLFMMCKALGGPPASGAAFTGIRAMLGFASSLVAVKPTPQVLPYTFIAIVPTT